MVTVAGIMADTVLCKAQSLLSFKTDVRYLADAV